MPAAAGRSIILINDDGQESDFGAMCVTMLPSSGKTPSSQQPAAFQLLRPVSAGFSVAAMLAPQSAD